MPNARTFAPSPEGRHHASFSVDSEAEHRHALRQPAGRRQRLRSQIEFWVRLARQVRKSHSPDATIWNRCRCTATTSSPTATIDRDRYWACISGALLVGIAMDCKKASDIVVSEEIETWVKLPAFKEAWDAGDRGRLSSPQLEVGSAVFEVRLSRNSNKRSASTGKRVLHSMFN